MSILIRIFIVDDHAVVRQGLAALISTVPDMIVVGDAADGTEAIERVPELYPDVIIMDLAMPGLDGVLAIEAIKQQNPYSRILVLTNFVEENRVLAALRAGAQGYLLKDAGFTNIIEAVRGVYDGTMILHPSISDVLAQVLQKTTRNEGSVVLEPSLTEREQDVLRLVAEGLTNKDIADALLIDDGTVRLHVSHILKKLGLENRTQAALYALRHKLASLDD